MALENGTAGEKPPISLATASPPSVRLDFYAEGYTEEELVGVTGADLEASCLDAEIRLLRTQLKRVAKQIRQMESNDPDFDPMRPFVSEYEVADIAVGPDGRPLAPLRGEGDQAGGEGGPALVQGQAGTMKRRTTRRAPDLYYRQDKLLSRLARYIALRADLQSQGTGTSDPGDWARTAAAFFRAAKDRMDGINRDDEEDD